VVVDQFAERMARVTKAFADSKSELARRAVMNSRLPTTVTAKVNMYKSIDCLLVFFCKNILLLFFLKLSNI